MLSLTYSYTRKTCSCLSQVSGLTSLGISRSSHTSRKTPGNFRHGLLEAPVVTSCVVRSNFGDEVEKGPLSASVDLVTELMSSVAKESDDSRLEAFMECLPDAIIDKAIASKKEAGYNSDTVCFADVLELLKVGDIQISDLLFDSYAMRMIIYQQPSGPPQLLSSLLTAPERSIHRLLVRSGGEECVLTVDLQLQEGLISQYRSSPRIASLWRIRGVSGERDPSESLPTSPNVTVGPETVVMAQLEALRICDIPGVYAFASPLNKSATGPLSNFSRLFDSPVYKPLLGHTKAESLRRIQLTKDTYAEVVGIVSDNTGVGRAAKVIYVWSVGRVPEQSGLEEAGCWMVNSVQMVSATSLT